MRLLVILSAVLLIFGNCKSVKDQQKLDFPAFDNEAHRGGRGLMPENTIAAMLNALNFNVNTLEMDTHITKDGKVVVTHDDSLSPEFTLLPNGKEIPKGEKILVYQTDYSQLQNFDVGKKYYPLFPNQKKIPAYIPLLSSLIDSVQNQIKTKNLKQVFYNIETKCNEKGDDVLHPKPEQFVDLLMKVIEAKKISNYVFIQSFDKRTLQVLHQKYPKIKTAYLISNKKSFDENLTDLGFMPFAYSPNYKLVDASLVEKSHQKHIKIIPWTVNTLEDINKLKNLGVDGIITDYPNLL
jgi:glycerophosphoryl diester phosphodiesterase